MKKKPQENWTFDVPKDVLLNRFMSAALYDYALNQHKRLTAWQMQMHVWQGHPGAFKDCALCFPKFSWYVHVWNKVRWWWDDHRPRLHFGPCDGGEEW